MRSPSRSVAFVFAALVASVALPPLATPAPAVDSPLPDGRPRATVDLASREGAALVRGTWRYSDVRVVEVDFRAPDDKGLATGAPVRTYDIAPHAGGVDFDDSGWPVIDPTSLAQRRGAGRVSFAWYRIAITVPDRVGDYDPTGATAVFETTLDDYAEVWVDGEIARALGQRGGSVVAGWNAPNRLVVGRNLRPGQRIQLAVFGMNGPISNPPTNFIFLRSAKLELFDRDGGAPHGPVAIGPHEVNVVVERLDPAIDAIVGANPKIFKLAEGFTFTEGPVWVPEASAPGGGHLLFSDPNENTIYRFAPEDPRQPAGRLEVFRRMSGYQGTDVARYKQPGSNGLALDAAGRLTLAEHGNRRISRLAADGSLEILADRFEGKRLNSPNDLVWGSDGTLYFTDPPFGLPAVFDDPAKELSWSGVFRLRAGKLEALDRTLAGPNGVALSPDERFLYVGNWDEQRKVVMRYEIGADGTVSPGVLFADLGVAPGADAIDGVKVDRAGDVFVSGPDGVWVLSPAGRHLGTIRAPRHVHNMAWGGAGGKTLYLCARDALYRMPLQVEGFVATPNAPR